MDPIVIANLLRIAFYAGDLLDELEDCEASVENGPLLFEGLLQAMLHRAGERIRLRGFERGYAMHLECGARPQGRILIADSITTSALPQRRLVCEFDEFGTDTPHNRVLKATANFLSRTANATEHADRLRALVREMRAVGDVKLSRRLLARLPRTLATRRYRVVRFVARTIVESGQADEQPGEHWARRLEQDPVRMRRLFERFVLRFAGAHRPMGTRAYRQILEWSEARQPDVPRLETDVVVSSRERVRVVECKYTPNLFAARPHGGRTFRPEHLRQLFAYLARAQESMTGSRYGNRPIDGVLLYPATGPRQTQAIDLGGFPARIATLPLGGSWSEMRARLEELLFGDA